MVVVALGGRELWFGRDNKVVVVVWCCSGGSGGLVEVSVCVSVVVC